MSIIGFNTSANPHADARRAETLADEALSSEPDNAEAHVSKVVVYHALVLTRDNAPSDPLWEAGMAEARAAVAIDRNNARAHELGAFYHLYVGRAAEAFAGIATAMNLSPRDPYRPW